MHIEHHPLIAEFPEHRDMIHRLKMENNHFANLANEYEKVDKAVIRAENGTEAVSDADLETLKKQRLSIKDSLYGMLTATA